jgi:hypothetical protein
MLIVNLLLLLIIIIITIVNKVIRKQYFLFNWYCENFYNIKQNVTKKELKYIYNTLNYSPIEILNKTMDGKRLSFISYSHKIKYNNIESDRFAIGSILLPDLSLMYSLDIFKERNIILPQYLLTDKNIKFYGLGWEFKNKIFKIYFRIFGKKNIKRNNLFKLLKNKKIKKDFNTEKYWDECLISFSYKNNKLYENKIYLYPKYNKKINYTYMISDKRGIIKQYDYFNNNTLNNKLGESIINKYKDIGIYLDTYSEYKDTKILYFPR